MFSLGLADFESNVLQLALSDPWQTFSPPFLKPSGGEKVSLEVGVLAFGPSMPPLRDCSCLVRSFSAPSMPRTSTWQSIQRKITCCQGVRLCKPKRLLSRVRGSAGSEAQSSQIGTIAFRGQAIGPKFRL